MRKRIMMLPAVSATVAVRHGKLLAHGISSGLGSVAVEFSAGGPVSVPFYVTNLHTAPAIAQSREYVPLSSKDLLYEYMPLSSHMATYRLKVSPRKTDVLAIQPFNVDYWRGFSYFTPTVLARSKRGDLIEGVPPFIPTEEGLEAAVRGSPDVGRIVLKGGIGTALERMYRAGSSNIRLFFDVEVEDEEPATFVPPPSYDWGDVIDALAEEALKAYPDVGLLGEGDLWALVAPVFFRVRNRWYAVAGAASFMTQNACLECPTVLPRTVRVGLFEAVDFEKGKFELAADLYSHSVDVARKRFFRALRHIDREFEMFYGMGLPAVSPNPRGVTLLWYQCTPSPAFTALYADIVEGVKYGPVAIKYIFSCMTDGLVELWAYGGVAEIAGDRWLSVFEVEKIVKRASMIEGLSTVAFAWRLSSLRRERLSFDTDIFAEVEPSIEDGEEALKHEEVLLDLLI